MNNHNHHRHRLLISIYIIMNYFMKKFHNGSNNKKMKLIIKLLNGLLIVHLIIRNLSISFNTNTTISSSSSSSSSSSVESTVVSESSSSNTSNSYNNIKTGTGTASLDVNITSSTSTTMKFNCSSLSSSSSSSGSHNNDNNNKNNKKTRLCHNKEQVISDLFKSNNKYDESNTGTKKKKKKNPTTTTTTTATSSSTSTIDLFKSFFFFFSDGGGVRGGGGGRGDDKDSAAFDGGSKSKANNNNNNLLCEQWVVIITTTKNQKNVTTSTRTDNSNINNINNNNDDYYSTQSSTSNSKSIINIISKLHRTWCLVIVGDDDQEEEEKQYYINQTSKHINKNIFYVSVVNNKNNTTKTTMMMNASTTTSSSSFIKSMMMGTDNNDNQMNDRRREKRNIGYLFAISNGAKLIFDYYYYDHNINLELLPIFVDDENNNVNETAIAPTKFLPSKYHQLIKDDDDDDEKKSKSTVLLKFLQNNDESSSKHTTSNNNHHSSSAESLLLFDPDPYMMMTMMDDGGGGVVVPKSTDQQQQKQQPLKLLSYGDIPTSSIGIVQSLIDDKNYNNNDDDDDDGGSRMLYDNSDTALPLLIPIEKYYNNYYNNIMKATLYTYEMFWGLYLPITTLTTTTTTDDDESKAAAEIWRGYIIQRLMKDIGLFVVVTPPMVFTTTTTTTTTKSTMNNDDETTSTSKSNNNKHNNKTIELLKFLDQWSSNSKSLPERIMELWIELYEHNYILIDDVTACQQWILILMYELNYKFPKIVNNDDAIENDDDDDDKNKNTDDETKHSKRSNLPIKQQQQQLPRIQPTIDGKQPFKAYPYFNVNKDGLTFSQYFNRHRNDYGEGKSNNNNSTTTTTTAITDNTTTSTVDPIETLQQKWLETIDWGTSQRRPENAVIKLIMMTMDEWPLIKYWVLYHGHILGFDNLYIIDSSQDHRCRRFLRYARDILGTNVIFKDVNINQLERIMSEIASRISGSSDFIIKMDTDEYLVVYDDTSKKLSSDLSTYLSGYASSNKKERQNHPLHDIVVDGKIGYIQHSIPDEKVCGENIYSSPNKFPLSPIMPTARGSVQGIYYKSIFFSRTFGMAGRTKKINLGGHAFYQGNVGAVTKFGIVHYHYRCIEIEMINCKRVLERSGYISPTDNVHQSKEKLRSLLGCSGEDLCNGSCQPIQIASYHKALLYIKGITCPNATKEEYYSGSVKEEKDDDGKITKRDDLTKSMRISQAKFGL